MIFNSIEFLLFFLPLFLAVYYIAPTKLKNIVLVLGSLLFYCYGDARNAVLLICSVIINFFVGKVLGEDGKHKWLFGVAVCGNLAVLLGFKLYLSGFLLPLGFSYYTFQIISYLTDVYRGEEEPEGRFLSFLVYVLMFPRLTLGPIVYYGEVKTQLRRRTVTVEDFEKGFQLFTLGLAGKVLLADRIGLLWTEIGTTGYESISTPLAWLGAVAFSLKLFFDFGGYSLMAVGLGRMLGFTLPQNFRYPYMACSVREFYKEWHITLGRWFGKYLYIPLGGSRRGLFRTIINLFIVWIATAFWHGCTLNFFLWGGILFLLIVVEKLLGDKVHLKVLPHLYIWFVIPITWICFAITKTDDLLIYLGRMFGLTDGIAISPGDWLLALKDYHVLLGIGAVCCTPLVEKLYRRVEKTLIGKVLLAVLFWFCVRRISLEGNNPFMYLHF